jgi:hypothetical protein
MKTLLRSLSYLLLLVLLVPSPGAAQPDLATSTVPNVFVAPVTGATTLFILLDAGGVPIPPAVIDLVWPPAAAAMTCDCMGSPIPLATTVSAPDGTASFTIAGGGCIDPATDGTGIDIMVDGVYFTTVGQVSPDLVTPTGAPAPDCAVGLADAVTVTGPLATGIYDFCIDVDSNGVVGLTDAIAMTPFIAGAAICTP